MATTQRNPRSCMQQLLNSRLSSLSRLLKIAVKVKEGSSYPPIAGNWEALLLEVKWGKLRRIFAASVKIACYFHDHHHYYEDQTQPKKTLFAAIILQLQIATLISKSRFFHLHFPRITVFGKSAKMSHFALVQEQRSAEDLSLVEPR